MDQLKKKKKMSTEMRGYVIEIIIGEKKKRKELNIFKKWMKT